MLSNTFRGKYFTIMKCYAPKHKLQRSIVKHGGKVLDSIERKVSYLITTEDSVNTSEMTIFAIENGHIRIINEHFVEACIKNRNILDIYDHKYSIYCLDWKACREQVQEYLENEKRVHSETIKLSASLTLAGGVFVVCGRLKKSKTEIQTLIIQNGGNIVDSVTKSATHVISSEDSLYSAKVQAGIAKRIPIVKEEFIEACIQSKTLLDLATKANSKFCIVAANEATRAQNINGNITQKMTQMRGQGNIFQDAVFTISGKLTSKNILTIEILQRGGIIKDTVTGKTTHVISDGITNAKVKTAKEKGIPIVRESFIRACVTEGQLLNLSLIKNKSLFIITPKEGKAAAKQPQKPSKAPSYTTFLPAQAQQPAPSNTAFPPAQAQQPALMNTAFPSAQAQQPAPIHTAFLSAQVQVQQQAPVNTAFPPAQAQQPAPVFIAFPPAQAQQQEYLGPVYPLESNNFVDNDDDYVAMEIEEDWG